MYRIILAILLSGIPLLTTAQQVVIRGRVTDLGGRSLPGATLLWAGTTDGVSASEDGTFSIMQKDPSRRKLVASYIGFVADTLIIPENYDPETENLTFNFRLRDENTLNTVVVESDRSSSFVSITKINLVEIITSKELKKAACCNLSESFETNAAVDVSFSDGVTGAKHITMLGLDG